MTAAAHSDWLVLDIYRDVARIRRLIADAEAAGLKITIRVDGEAAGTYVVEPDFELELMGVPQALDKLYGFVPAGRR